MGIPHLSVPLTLGGNGAFAVLEQDSAEDVAQSVATCLLTPVDSRVEVPDYGTPRGEFVGPLPGEIVAALAEWEPRADLDVDVVTGLGDGGELSTVAVAVRPHL